MITYNPRDWFRLIFQFHKSDTFRILLPTMIVLGLFTASLVYLELNNHVHLKSSTVFHQILGFILSMLLVFRINTAYERWWEGRKLWGSLINNSRSLMTKLNAYIGKTHSADLHYIRQLLIAFPYTLRNHLREDFTHNGIPTIDGLNKEQFAATHNKPFFIHRLLVDRVQSIREAGGLSEQQLFLINNEIFALIDITGACERIKNSPIPFSYSLFLKKIIFVYIITMPIAFSLEYRYWAIPAVMIIFYAFASLELVSEEVEEPFGMDSNDLPTDELADKINRDLSSIF
jgi:putative membrane protein